MTSDKHEKEAVQAASLASASELDHSFKLGISSGLEQAANALLKEASDLWISGHDKNAELLRNWSQILKERSRKSRPERDS